MKETIAVIIIVIAIIVVGIFFSSIRSYKYIIQTDQEIYYCDEYKVEDNKLYLTDCSSINAVIIDGTVIITEK